jgi:hypothetical protein
LTGKAQISARNELRGAIVGRHSRPAQLENEAHPTHTEAAHMKTTVSSPSRFVALWAVAAALGLAVPATAQTVSGQARAIQTNVVGPGGVITTTMLADTGALSGSTDAREASAEIGAVAPLVAVNTLHATAIGWPDQAKSEASVADLNVTVAGTSVGADFVMARASAVQGLPASASVNINGLLINGVPVAVTGSANQTINIPGGRVVIHEQSGSSTGTVVNALRISVNGVADVIVAYATARVQ